MSVLSIGAIGPLRPLFATSATAGELVHVDVKKLAGIPDGGGWRAHGKGAANGMGRDSYAGYRYLHSALDDRTRLVYSEIHDDEQGVTAAAFFRRAVEFFAEHGITVERVISDNGACFAPLLGATSAQRQRSWRSAPVPSVLRRTGR